MLLLGCSVRAAESPPVDDPIPARTEGVGPHARVVLRNVTIVNGKLRAELRDIVAKQKAQRNIPSGPMRIETADVSR